VARVEAVAVLVGFGHRLTMLPAPPGDVAQYKPASPPATDKRGGIVMPVERKVQ